MTRTTNLIAAGLLAAALPTTGAFAVEADIEAKAREYLEGTVAAWLADPIVVEAIKAQNAANAGLTEADIAILDQAWIAEAEMGGGALFQEVVQREVSQYLISHQMETGGIVAELWIMDNLGLNVGQTALTADLMQGDEAKWQQTYPMGPGAILVEEVEFAEELQAYTFNASMTVVDPATGEAIGAVTVGFNADLLM